MVSCGISDRAMRFDADPDTRRLARPLPILQAKNNLRN
jgi:hypothetical protein